MRSPRRMLFASTLLLGLISSGAEAGSLLPYTRFHLDNGLTVIVHEDHSSPVVAVDVWYHVGSRNERPGKTGFAHLFEHLMFQGSKHVGDDKHIQFVSEAGGSMNGTTNRDRTNYFELVPSNYLERMLWLEADRMGFLLETMTKEKLDNQRDVVKNERRQNYENRPYGMVPKVLAEKLFPAGHPYHHLTIGEHADLEAASLDDVKDFFRTYYAPNNATLVIAGDVTAARARELVEKWFGSIPPGKELAKEPPPPLPRLAREERAELEDKVSLERLYLAWPTPPAFKVGDAELDILSEIIAGKAGRLYQRLVHDLKIAQSVSASQGSGLHASEFEISVTCKPGHTAAEVLAVVDEELAKLRAAAPTAAELERAKNGLEAATIFALQSVGSYSGRADRIAYYSFYTGDPGYLDRDLERYRKATAEDVRATVKQWLGSGRVVVTVRPRKKTPSSPAAAEVKP